jgi:tetratricopeptide (TPR) repeat protein
MVTATRQPSAAHLRVAAYYLKKLGDINHLFSRGGENATYSLQILDQEWEQIRRWRNWAVANADADPQIGQMAAAFPRAGHVILNLRLSNQDFLEWHQTGFDCAARGHNAAFRLDDLLNLAYACLQIYDNEAVNTYVRMALKAYDPENNYDKARVYRFIGLAEQRQGQVEQARDYLEQSLVLYRAYGDRSHVANLNYELSSLAGMSGDFARAREHVTRALPFYRQSGDFFRAGKCLNNLGLIEFYEGHLDLAEAYLRESLALAEQLNYLSNISQALTNLSAVAHARGDYDQVEAYETRSLALSQEIGDRYGVAMSQNNLGKVALIRSQLDVAETYFRAALALFEQMNDRFSMVECLTDAGHCALQRQDDAGAERLYQEGAAIATAVSHQPGLIDLLRALVKLYVKQRRLAEADECLQQMCGLALHMKSLPYQVKVVASAVRLLFAQRPENSTTAIRWLGLAYSHQAAEPRIQQELDDLRALFADVMGAAEIQMLLQEGTALTLEGVLTELITQFKPAAG